MNNFDKSVLAFKFIQYMQLMSRFSKDYYKIISEKYPMITESNFVIGEKSTVSPTTGTEITNRLMLQIQYRYSNLNLHIQQSWENDGDGIPQRKYIRAIQYTYDYPAKLSLHAWISHLGASMYYGDHTDSTIVVNNEDIQVMTPYECNTLLQGSTEEMEFQYSTLLDFDDLTMIQYGVLSLLTADNIRDTINITAPDLSLWEDSLTGMDEVLHKLREGILTDER